MVGAESAEFMRRKLENGNEENTLLNHIMLSLKQIQTVSHYELKLLSRTWIFRLFGIFEILYVISILFERLIVEGDDRWIFKAVPGHIPYMSISIITLGQVIALMFLAPDFLKRDRRADTSEVYFIHSFSNGEYILGKFYGCFKLFFLLTAVLLVVTAIFNFVAVGVTVDVGAYLFYWLVIWFPAVVFTIGLSVFVHLGMRSQALSFGFLLISLIVTAFWGDRFYYILDFTGYHQPMTMSTVVGYSGLESVLVVRLFYLFVGCSFIAGTVLLYKRLENNCRMRWIWLIESGVFALFAIFLAVGYFYRIERKIEHRAVYIALNNRYVQEPKLRTFRYEIELEQFPDGWRAVTKVAAISPDSVKNAVFCINPGLRISSVLLNDTAISYRQEEQIVRIDYSKATTLSDTLWFTFQYEGAIDESFCYLDIPDDLRGENIQQNGIRIGRRFHFQTSRYLLLTPECYWYPRSGTAYSDTDTRWQQNYFHHFRLRVKPLPGLIPVSQGRRAKQEDAYVFTPDDPMQNLTLAIGNYGCKQSTVGRVTYAVHYIRDYGCQLDAFHCIADTLPVLIRDEMETFEARKKLDYPFSRLDVVEVPASFGSFPRFGTQAQEVMQPGMILFPEKALFFQEFDVEGRKERHRQWSKRNGAEISELEQEIRVCREMLRRFTNQHTGLGYAKNKKSRSVSNVAVSPYYIYPQLYNFRYNIYSERWPIANRLIEIYLGNYPVDNENWQRENYGVTNIERCNIALSERPFDQILADSENRDLLNQFLYLKGNMLFAEAALRVGVEPLQDSIFAVLKRQRFDLVNFEHLLDSIAAVSGVSFDSLVENWNCPVVLPRYEIGESKLTRYYCNGDNYYEYEMSISNLSDVDGMVRIEIPRGNMRPLEDRIEAERVDQNKRMLSLKAHETKRIVSQWSNMPRWVHVHTLVSANLPNVISRIESSYQREYIRQETKEADFVVPFQFDKTSGEIIVDNEDSLLFSVHSDVNDGYLYHWINASRENTGKYKGFKWWRPPSNWVSTLNNGYYGGAIRSAVAIRRGTGHNYARWRVPVPDSGRYDVFHYVFRNGEFNNRRREGEYNFKVRYNGEEEEAYIRLQGRNSGWEQLGTYCFDRDTVEIILTDETELRSVTADAVRFVKRPD